MFENVNRNVRCTQVNWQTVPHGWTVDGETTISIILSLPAEHTSGAGRPIEGENGHDSQTSNDREPRGMVYVYIILMSSASGTVDCLLCNVLSVCMARC